MSVPTAPTPPRESRTHTRERVTASVAREEELGYVPEVGGGNFEQDTEGGTASVAHEGYPTKSGYLNFVPGGISKTNWRPTVMQV